MINNKIMDKFSDKKDEDHSIEIDGNPSVEEIALIVSLFSFKEVNR